MSNFRNSAEIPLILVGTQGILKNKLSIYVCNFYNKNENLPILDAISENKPRVIDDSRARKLANDLKRCSYYETCATYGLNVEKVFQDG